MTKKSFGRTTWSMDPSLNFKGLRGYVFNIKILISNKTLYSTKYKKYLHQKMFSAEMQRGYFT